MGSKSDTIETDTKCSCGHGDKENNQKNYFRNLCPNCGREGTLYTRASVKQSSENQEESNESESINSTQSETQNMELVCKECGETYCGQDGYDLAGGTRGRLETVNPDDVSDENEEVSSTDDDGETTYMSGWEGLCDLLKPLDGLAMMVQRGDCVIVQKIETPQTAKLWAYEGINVVDDSVSITDYTPEIYNTFVIKWGESFENELEFTFNKHKQLFGERKIVLEAKKVQVAASEEDDDKEDKGDDEKNKGISDVLSSSSISEKDLKNIDTKNLDTKNLNTEDVSKLTNTDDKETPATEEVPITDREEAIQFGLTQVGKAKRDDGHTIELKVIGNQLWQMGEWCHVRLPSFNEDSYMFVSKCSFESAADSEYINSLTLVDYPPSLGKPSKKSQEENTEENTEDSDSSESSGDSDSTESSDSSDETSDESSGSEN